MDFDLKRGLQDLGTDVRGTSLPVDLLVRRAHRRRVVRATTYSAVGTGAAAALAVGGIALADGRPPAPAPAAPTPSTTPTPTADVTPVATPTSTPTPTPTPTFQPSWELCGADVEAVWEPGVGGGYWGSASGTGPEGVVLAEIGGPVTAALELHGIDGHTEALTAEITRTVVSAWDDTTFRYTVVGVATSAGDNAATGTVSPDGALGLGTLTTTMAACASAPTEGGAGDGALVEGMYWLLAETVLTHADGSTTTTLTTGSLAVGEPDELSSFGTDPVTPAAVTGEASGLAPQRYGVESLGIPGCGAAWYATVPPATWWTLSGGASVAGGSVEVDVTATGTGLDIVDGAALEPLVTVTRDGVVVAQTPDESRTPFAVAGWITGSTVTRHVSLPAVACTDVAGARAGEALPAGEYQVWALQGVFRDQSGAAGVNAHYGGPWTLVVP